MTKDVLVKISGLQFAEDQDNGPVEIINTPICYTRFRIKLRQRKEVSGQSEASKTSDRVCF